jgi:hypothetical protein
MPRLGNDAVGKVASFTGPTPPSNNVISSLSPDAEPFIPQDHLHVETVEEVLREESIEQSLHKFRMDWGPVTPPTSTEDSKKGGRDWPLAFLLPLGPGNTDGKPDWPAGPKEGAPEDAGPGPLASIFDDIIAPRAPAGERPSLSRSSSDEEFFKGKDRDKEYVACPALVVGGAEL